MRAVENPSETWDALPSDLKPTEIDREAVREFFSLAKPRLRGAKESNPPQRILENLYVFSPIP